MRYEYIVTDDILDLLCQVAVEGRWLKIDWARSNQVRKRKK